jgi:acetyltransferase-like isoleucine patch superfamily enzyme
VRTLLLKIYRRLWQIINAPRFKELGTASYMDRPMQLRGTRYIRIGKGSRIGYKGWLAAVKHVDNIVPSINIGNCVAIGNFNHIYAVGSIIIEDEVLTADSVYISDNSHDFQDIEVAVRYQRVKFLQPVTIGEGSWLGEHVCVIGASVGKHCVIGSNAVVTKDIPDYSVAVGAPAKVIKQFNHNTKRWEKV